MHVSREELHSIEVPPSFEADGSFDVRLVNHGEPLHIHLHLDDALSEVGRLDAGNHYVEGESERRVRVDIETDRFDGETHRGKLKIASAYGAVTRWVDIELSTPDPTTDTVQVGESLATPQPRTETDTGGFATPIVAVLGLAIVALLVSGVAAATLREPTIIIGSLVVLGGVAGALFFIFRDAVGSD